jgi:hypothetical protein
VGSRIASVRVGGGGSTVTLWGGVFLWLRHFDSLGGHASQAKMADYLKKLNSHTKDTRKIQCDI